MNEALKRWIFFFSNVRHSLFLARWLTFGRQLKTYKGDGCLFSLSLSLSLSKFLFLYTISSWSWLPRLRLLSPLHSRNETITVLTIEGKMTTFSSAALTWFCAVVKGTSSSLVAAVNTFYSTPLSLPPHSLWHTHRVHYDNGLQLQQQQQQVYVQLAAAPWQTNRQREKKCPSPLLLAWRCVGCSRLLVPGNDDKNLRVVMGLFSTPISSSWQQYLRSKEAKGKKETIISLRRSRLSQTLLSFFLSFFE